jgi:hypothetical protein
MDTKVFGQLQKRYEHTDTNYAVRIGLEALNSALLDLIERVGYTEKSLITEALNTRAILKTTKLIPIDWLVDRLTQTAIDFDTVKGS